MTGKAQSTLRQMDDRGHPIRGSTDRAVIRSLSSQAAVWFQSFLALLAIGLSAGLFWVAAFALGGGVADPLTVLIGLSAVIVGIGFLMTARRLWSAGRGNVAMLLAHGRCGQCTYIVHGLVPEQDACVVCPECGAAWRTEAIGRPSRQRS